MPLSTISNPTQKNLVYLISEHNEEKKSGYDACLVDP